MKLLIFSPIAERDVHFYIGLAQELVTTDKSCKIAFLSYYQPGNHLIEQAGFEVLDPYPLVKAAEGVPALEIQRKYGVQDVNALIQHELLTFGLENEDQLIAKFRKYLFACDQLLSDLEKRHPEVKDRFILHELAGFIGPLSLYLCGIQRGWTNLFFEPSFFKGRLHFVENSLDLNIPSLQKNAETATQVRKYLESALSNKVVVAAKKDLHHYKDMGFAKLFNTVNFKKLTKKLYYKFIAGKKQEFDHILNHSLRSLNMFKNRRKNSKNYSRLADLDPKLSYFYFPFHVQLDFALTIRCPEWLDQIALVEKIIQRLPENAVLLTKEHPASIGCLDQSRLEKLFKSKKFRLMQPMTNSYDIMEKCKAIITINSKVGAEAICLKKPVFAFGKAFYSNSTVVNKFSDWARFDQFVKDSLSGQLEAPNEQEWVQFLENVHTHSFKCELYDLNPQNIKDMCKAISERIQL